MSELIDWLLEGDIAIQFQTKRDLLDLNNGELLSLQNRISEEGWGKAFLNKRDNKTGLWGNGIYSPKWISTHYTLLDLKNLGLSQKNSFYIESSKILLDKLWFNQGKIRKTRYQDVCVCAMVISICSYAKIKSGKIYEIIDYILEKHYPDGGWNCNWEKEDKHSSLHTTLSVLEGIRDYLDYGGNYRVAELISRQNDAHEFLLLHQLYKSHRTKEVIDKKMLMFSYPNRWRYDILRCLDYFQSIDKPYDTRLDDAIEILIKKRKNNKWPLQQKHAGKVHFDMEQTGRASRWNTLRALRVLKKYRPELFNEIIGCAKK
jgi:hypothetical protein